MKLILSMAVALGSAALLPAPAAVAAAASSGGAEHRTCTRVERRGGSRLSTQRVCLTAEEWRQRLGNDWRQILNSGGVTPEQALDTVELESRSTLAVPTGPAARGGAGLSPH